MTKMMKQYLRWIILGGTLFFLGKTLKDNWFEVTAIHIDAIGWATLAIATGVTLLAHIWAGWPFYSSSSQNEHSQIFAG
jgi:glycosyltransferase 2 family protein